MRFATVILSGALALVASAQSDTTATAATPTQSISPAQSSAAACLAACKPGDVDCQSHCITVPSPDKDQVNATNKCVANCPQGNGTKAETDKYTECTQKCIKDNYYVSSVGTPKATGGSGGSGSDNNGGSSSSGSDASQTSGGSGGSGGSSASGTGATATRSGGASGTNTASGGSSTSTGLAPMLTAAPAAVVGLVAAVLAL
ncbi:hypothetical protein JDV02_001432 [Purpureocillium takamizusanense]|uniref:Uncharacterized protein n=1 Tax=Purpureocillium takamizusanense TaxID=2060973 RepID=A0A9Q8Q731_9HYPO|nr:uncharacterized protein JDV02_001432 [Purpureocillium takamizusanense]UNI14843.1 hypothetical protein JDV02_001432 [Purpureocillium takamizusanense]